MLIINNRAFYPQPVQRSGSNEEKLNINYNKKRRGSIEFNETECTLLNNCVSLGDAVHEPHLFIDQSHSSDFLCTICMCICNKPTNIGCNHGHIYCNECLNDFFKLSSNGKCPQCQDNVTQYKNVTINKFALRLLLKLKIFCPFSDHNYTHLNMNNEDRKLYQCDWIGCYSDIIDHLKYKCKYGTFLDENTIQIHKDKLYKQYLKQNALNQNQNQIIIKSNPDPWNISRAAITTYKIIWEQLCENDNNLGNHINKSSANNYFRKTYFGFKRIQKLWMICGCNNQNLIEENQFYAALHVIRLDQDKYNLNNNTKFYKLNQLPQCLQSRNINKIRYNIQKSHIYKSDNTQQQEQKHISSHSLTYLGVDLNTKIGTFYLLNKIASISIEIIQKKKKKKKKKRRKSSSSISDISNAINGLWNNNQVAVAVAAVAVDWKITKKDIYNEYNKWFIKADLNGDGWIDGKECNIFFSQSSLPRKDLAKIWKICDEPKRSKLSEAQFYAFFHIVKKILTNSGKVAIPDVVPLCLKEKNILNIMNNNNNNLLNNIDNDDPLNLLFDTSINSSSLNATISTQSLTTNYLNSTNNSNYSIDMDNLDPINMNNLNDNDNNRRQVRTDSIDSVHDWGDFGWD